MTATARNLQPDRSGLYPAGEDGGAPTPGLVRKLYERGLSYNAAMGLEETVRSNENFYIGRQWEGVKANGLPTPVFNILKRVTNHLVAAIAADNIRAAVSAEEASPATEQMEESVRIVNEELAMLTKRNKLSGLMYEFARNAAVDGDGCLYTWWDTRTGGIRTETIENTRVFFGNRARADVQEQPYIIIESREYLSALKKRAEEGDKLRPEGHGADEGRCRVLLLMWRDRATGHIWSYECTPDAQISGERDMGIRLYPICWMNWDKVQGSYHGQALITGLIPNQIFINRCWAMAQLSLQTTAFPKVIYDRTRIARWDNRVGAAIGVNGGDVAAVARIMDPAAVSPQISQFISECVSQTESAMGASPVALGDYRSENASAIIALQKASAAPSEITKQNLYRAMEELFSIYIEFMAGYYGRRAVDITADTAGIGMPGAGEKMSRVADFDFSSLFSLRLWLRVDVGAGSYYSELASIETLDNLLKLGFITLPQYLERVPDGYIPAKAALIAEARGAAERNEEKPA